MKNSDNEKTTLKVVRNAPHLSRLKREGGFQPAFLNLGTRRVEIARYRNGLPARFHLIAWLPHKWAKTLGCDGSVRQLKEGILAGFLHKGVFYNRDEAEAITRDLAFADAC